MNVAEEEAEKHSREKRWLSLVVGVVIALVFAWVLAASHFGNDYLPSKTFAGCYVSPNGDPLELDPSGGIQSRRSAVGTFKVLAPVGGKHGPLVDVDRVSVLTKGANIYFQRGRDGYFWAVSDGSLQVVFPPDHSVTFQKVSAAHCR